MLEGFSATFVELDFGRLVLEGYNSKCCPRRRVVHWKLHFLNLKSRKSFGGARDQEVRVQMVTISLL